jgi:hypothetical protein
MKYHDTNENICFFLINIYLYTGEYCDMSSINVRDERSYSDNSSLGNHGSDEEERLFSRRERDRTLSSSASSRSLSSISQVSASTSGSTSDGKRLLAEVYLNGASEPYDSFEVGRIKEVIKHNIFPQTKFCKGDVRSSKKKKVEVVIGKSHEAPDLTKTTGYAVNILDLCGRKVGGHKGSLRHRAQWWKTYQACIKKEISQRRGQIMHHSKDLFKQGKINE